MFCLKTRTFFLLWREFRYYTILPFREARKDGMKKWLSTRSKANWNNRTKLKESVMVLIRKGSHQYALRKAFKCVSHEVNKLLIKLLDFNNVKSTKVTIFSVKVKTKFGIFNVRLINKDSTGGFNTRLHLEVPVKFLFKLICFIYIKSLVWITVTKKQSIEQRLHRDIIKKHVRLCIISYL